MHVKIRGRKCDVIGMNARVSTEGKSGDTEDYFYEKLERVLDHFTACHLNIFRENSTRKWREKIFLNRQFGKEFT